MEGDCNVYAHSSLWMRPTGEWSINAKMVYWIRTACWLWRHIRRPVICNSVVDVWFNIFSGSIGRVFSSTLCAGINCRCGDWSPLPVVNNNDKEVTRRWSFCVCNGLDLFLQWFRQNRRRCTDWCVDPRGLEWIKNLGIWRHDRNGHLIGWYRS